jgi:hypothetical protein
LSQAIRQPGSRKNPRRVSQRGFETRIRAYRFTKNVAPFSSGLATFRATVSFSQQADFSVQVVRALLLTLRLPQAAFSEQFILALLVTFALSALAAWFVLEDFPSPACATNSEVKQANVKQTMNFFITVSTGLIVAIFTLY